MAISTSNHRTTPIRVLHVLPAIARGGTEELLYNIFSYLDPGQFELHILCTHEAGDQSQHSRFAQIGVGIHILPRPKTSLRRIANIQRVLAVRRFLVKERFSIVHVHNYNDNATYARLGAVLAGVPVILTHDHGTRPEAWRDALAWRFLNPFTYLNVTNSEACRQYRLRTCGGQHRKVITILNGLNVERFRQLKVGDIGATRVCLGLPAESRVIIAAGRMVPLKRFHLFVEAAAFLPESKHALFLLLGHGPLREELKSLACRLGVGHKVRFQGWLEDPRDLYRVADVTVVTSNIREGFGLVSAEAMASGIPVVAVDNATHREVVTPECGLLVPPKARDIAHAIDSLLEDHELASRLGSNGQRRALGSFDVRRTARELADIYDQGMADRNLLGATS